MIKRKDGIPSTTISRGENCVDSHRRNIREENKVIAQRGCNRVIQISVRIFLPPWMPIRLCVLSKRIYSSRVKLGVPCNILNTLIDISQSADFYLPRVIYFCLYVSSFYSISFLPRYFPLPPLPPIIDDRPLLDICGFVLTTLLTSRFVFSITSDPKEFARILSVNSKSSG